MSPDDSGAFQTVFGAFRSCSSPEKSKKHSKMFADFFFSRKIICWESFETVFAEVSDRTELILGGKRSFKVWRTGFRYVRTGFKYRILRALNTVFYGLKIPPSCIS